VNLLLVAGKPRYDLGSNEEVEYFGKGKFTYLIYSHLVGARGSVVG
jgi:hypothetical protein